MELHYLEGLSEGGTFFDSKDPENGKERYNSLHNKKDEIEIKFGERLDWDYKEGRKQHYIRSHCQIGGIDDKDTWGSIQDDLVKRMHRLEGVLKDYMVKLPG